MFQPRIRWHCQTTHLCNEMHKATCDFKSKYFRMFLYAFSCDGISTHFIVIQTSLLHRAFVIVSDDNSHTKRHKTTALLWFNEFCVFFPEWSLALCVQLAFRLKYSFSVFVNLCPVSERIFLCVIKWIFKITLFGPHSLWLRSVQKIN